MKCKSIYIAGRIFVVSRHTCASDTRNMFGTISLQVVACEV